MNVRHLLTTTVALACALLPLPAHASTLPATVLTVDVAQCFAIDAVTDPTVALGSGGAVPCTSDARLPTRCDIHGDDEVGSQTSVSRACTASWVYLDMTKLCLTGSFGGELWVYGAGEERIVTDLHATVVAGQGPAATLGIYWQDRGGEEASGVAAGTVGVATMSGNPCALTDRVYVAITLTGPFAH